MAAGYITRTAKDSAGEPFQARFRSIDSADPNAPAFAVHHLDPDQLTALQTTIGQLGSQATQAQILAALQAQADLAVSLWTDNSGAFYVRRDNRAAGGITVTWTTPAGADATPGAGLRPAANEESLSTQEASFHASAIGAGYAVGDVIVRQVVLDLNTTPATVVTSTWVNLSSGAVIAAPNGAHLVLASKDVTVASSALPSGAATDAKLDAILTALNATPASIPPRAVSTTGVLSRLAFTVSGADIDAIIPLDAAKKIHVVRLRFSISGPATLTFKDEQGDVSLVYGAAGVEEFAFSEHPHFSTAINQAFSIGKSAAVTLTGWVDYYKA